MSGEAVKRRPAPFRLLDLLPAPKPPFADPAGRTGFWAPLTRAPRHVIAERRVARAGIGPRPWRIALLADFHTGGHAGDVARYRRVVADTNALAPDLVLLLGDYVNMMSLPSGRVPPETTAAILAGLAAPGGVYAVLGNHDWDYGRDAVAWALSRAGITVIDNRIATVTQEGAALALIGLEDDNRGRPDLGLIGRAPVGAARLVVTHDPGLFHDIPPGEVMVAGHVHGGQIRLPGLPALVMPRGRSARHWAHGHIREKGGDLIVSAGLGASGLPFRFGIAPEIVVLTLTEPAAGDGGGRVSGATCPAAHLNEN